jgi:hypothetical protein
MSNSGSHYVRIVPYLRVTVFSKTVSSIEFNTTKEGSTLNVVKVQVLKAHKDTSKVEYKE